MSTTDYGNNSETKWNALKSKLYALTRKGASRGPGEREDVLRTIQDLNMSSIENSSGIEQLKNGRQTDWTPQGENIDNGFVDMRARYVRRTRLSWTGLYGKEPWPRERKQWEKI